MSNIEQLVDKKQWLAPLAGFTDIPFRTICKKCGADVMTTEMVSSDGLVYDFEKSFRYGIFNENEKPIGVQVFGSNPQIIAQSVELLLNIYHKRGTLPDFIDINMGCPVKKVVKRGAGAALLNNLPLAGKIVSTTKKILAGTNIPLSVKIRSGWDSSSIVGVEAAELFADMGADILIVHPRTRSQMYSGLSDWSVIRDIKQRVHIPVIGNGDINSVDDAIRMYQYTGCDSVMIGRGALGNPWIFNEIKTYLLTGKPELLSSVRRYELIEEHFKLSIDQKGVKRAVIEMRAHLCYYTKGLKGGSIVRRLINSSNDVETMFSYIKELFYG